MAIEKSSVDMYLVERVYAVAMAFQQAFRWDDGLRYAISWPFKRTYANFDKYIRTWLEIPAGSIAWTTHYPSRDDKSQKIQAMLDEGKDVAAFYYISTRNGIWPSSYHTMKAEFIRWALPQMMTVFAELAKLVQPELYQQVLYAFTGKREQGQQD